MKTSLLALRRRATMFGLSLACFALVGAARAEDAPKFSDADVTSFVKSYGEFTDLYAANMKSYMAAVKSGDATKMQAEAAKMQTVQTKSTELQTKGATIGGKLKPDEAQKYSDYMSKCAQKMADAAKAQ